MRSIYLPWLLASIACLAAPPALASLRIEGGYWQFCTDANFQGTCHTFGPGQYARLPGDITNRISSGRRVEDQYNQPAARQR